MSNRSLYPMSRRFTEAGARSRGPPQAQDGKPPRHISTLTGFGRELPAHLTGDSADLLAWLGWLKSAER